MYTRVYDFEHERTDSTIGLVGVVHVAERSYFDDLQREIDTHVSDNTIVHLEGIDGDEKSSLFGRFACIAYGDNLIPVQNTQEAILTTPDRAYLQFPAWAETHDISYADIDAQLTANDRMFIRICMAAGRISSIIDRLASLMPSISDDSEGTSRRMPHDTNMQQGNRIMRILDGYVTHHFESLDKILIDSRNEHALHAVDEALDLNPNAEQLLVWGDEHLAGLCDGIKDRGYHVVRAAAHTYD